MSVGEPEAPGSGGDSSAPTRRKTANPRILLVTMAFWILYALVWLTLTVRSFAEGDRDYVRLVLGLAALVLAVAYFVMWRQAKARLRDQS